MNKHEKKYDKVTAQIYKVRNEITNLIDSLERTLNSGVVGQHGVVITSEDARIVVLKLALQRAYRQIYDAERGLVVAWDEANGDMALPAYETACERNEGKEQK